MKRFAINGAGRIGRLVIREYLHRKPDNLTLVAINDLTDTDTLAYLLEFDSVHGRLAGPVESSNCQLRVSDNEIPVYHHSEPERLPWSTLQWIGYWKAPVNSGNLKTQANILRPAPGKY